MVFHKFETLYTNHRSWLPVYLTSVGLLCICEVINYKYFESKFGSWKSDIDPNNPPDHVRGAAAGMGLSVPEFKKKYLDRPNMCDFALRDFEKCSLRHEESPEALRYCNKFFATERERLQCGKFEKLYQNRWFI